MRLNRIKEVLCEKDISQTWLAKKLDKSFNSVNSYVYLIRELCYKYPKY